MDFWLTFVWADTFENIGFIIDGGYFVQASSVFNMQGIILWPPLWFLCFDAPGTVTL